MTKKRPLGNPRTCTPLVNRGETTVWVLWVLCPMLLGATLGPLGSREAADLWTSLERCPQAPQVQQQQKKRTMCYNMRISSRAAHGHVPKWHHGGLFTDAERREMGADRVGDVTRSKMGVMPFGHSRVGVPQLSGNDAHWYARHG
jgi:hypothetical protein